MPLTFLLMIAFGLVAIVYLIFMLLGDVDKEIVIIFIILVIITVLCGRSWFQFEGWI